MAIKLPLKKKAVQATQEVTVLPETQDAPVVSEAPPAEAPPAEKAPPRKAPPGMPKSLALLQGLQPSDEPSEIDQIVSRITHRAGNFVIDTGKDLMRAKELLAHGEWGDWLKTNFSWSPSTAQNYMNVAKLVAKNPTVGNLRPTALITLSAPSTPEEVVAEVIAETASGAPPSPKAVKEKVQKAKGKATKSIIIKEQKAEIKDKAAKPNSLMETIQTPIKVKILTADPVVTTATEEPEAEDGSFYKSTIEFLREIGFDEAALLFEKAFPDLMINVTVG